MRVVAVNVSDGGVPKLPVDRAFVGTLGVEGDGHSEMTVHGGPYRAVCLYGVEAIERLRAEGHPVGPGSVGENLTTSGVDWSDQEAGTLIRVGERLLLELTTPASPCSTQKHNFRGGRIGRISVLTHPSDSRMYARVVEEGEVRPGDDIQVLPRPIGSAAGVYQLLDRLDDCETEADLRLWRAAGAAGMDVRIIDDGELAAVAAPDSPGPALNICRGLRKLPHLLPMVVDHFGSAGVVGWLPMETEPWPGAVPAFELAIATASPLSVAVAEPVEGVNLRRLDADEWSMWASVVVAATDDGSGATGSLTSPAPRLLATRGVHVIVAEEGGIPVGAGMLHVHRRVGLMRAGMVVPRARGRGIQRALLSERTRLADELGCDVVTSQATPGSASGRNLTRMGLRQIWRRPVYRYDGTTGPAPSAAP